MKGYRFINTMQSIASYMVGFNTKKITYEDYNSWCSYLEKVLTTKDYQAIVFYGKTSLDELKREDNGFMFNIGDYSIKLADGKSKRDLDENILSYVETDVLLAMLDAAERYEEVKQNKELIL